MGFSAPRAQMRTSYGTFISGFAKKRLAGPYGSYDKFQTFSTINILSFLHADEHIIFG